MSATSRSNPPPPIVLVLVRVLALAIVIVRVIALALALVPVLVLGACHRPPSPTTTDASPPPPSTPLATAPPDPPRATIATRGPLASGEAPINLVQDREHDPVLRPFLGRVRERFKDPRAPLTVQRASLFGGGAATLVSELAPSETMPLLWVEDRERKLLWEKERPTAAMLPPVRDPVIVGRSKGGVALFAYDVPAKVVAGRLLDADGTPFTDINIIRTDECHRMSAAHFPKRGIVVVCSRPRGALLQLLREDHTLGYDSEGVAAGAPFRVPAPMSVAFDTDATMMLVQFATRDRADHVLVFRLDAAGRPLWPEPRDLGEVSRASLPAPRIAVTDLPGGVRVTLPGPTPRVVEIDSDGAIRPTKG